MSEEKNTNSAADQTKEQRLAAKLRENLRRRKAQSREMSDETAQSGVPKTGGES